ncbi:MAG: aminopeptidase P family N-terminal domain-containing protein, partial [Pseudomonadota bacterium]
MTMHFDDAEYAGRQAEATRAINEAGLDALLMFAPESQYWICGYDTFGFAMFQCLVLTAKGELHLLTRLPDLRQARLTSTLSEAQIHVWAEKEGSNPARSLYNLLMDLGVAGGQLGVETQTAGLTDYNGQFLR